MANTVTKRTSEAELVERAPRRLELKSLPTDELHERLRSAIGVTADAIRRMADLWHELVRRGEDMSRYRTALTPFLAGVAQGRLLPALVVQLSGQTRTLEKVATLSVADQERLLAGEPVEIYRGEDRTEELPLRDLLWSDVAQAIGDGRIRSAAEQKLAYDRSRAHRAKTATRRGRQARVTVTEDNRVRIGKMAVDAERVIAALREHGLID